MIPVTVGDRSLSCDKAKLIGLPFFAKMLESGMEESRSGIKFPEEHYDAVTPVLMYLTEKKNVFEDILYEDLCKAYILYKENLCRRNRSDYTSTFNNTTLRIQHQNSIGDVCHDARREIR